MKINFVLSYWIFYVVVFAFFFYFFTLIHPIAPFDSDDWSNMILERPTYPSLDCWNPTKVFPERFEPFVATLAGYLIVPLIGDYINSLILANALIVSLFIIIYLYSVQRYIETRFTLNSLSCLALMTIYIILHFLILRTTVDCNEYLWYSNDSNCYYHYIIPNMLCASLVLWLMRHDVRTVSNGRIIAALLVLTYLALCSNLYSVVILIAFIGANLLMNLITIIPQTSKPYKYWIASYFRQNVVYLAIIALWGVIQWIESEGIRANSYGYLHKPLILSIKITIHHFLNIRYNNWFLLFSLLTIAGAKLIDFKQHKYNFWHFSHHERIIFLSLCLSTSYLVLLSSRVNPEYVQRGDVIFEYAFFFLLLVILALAYIITHIRLIVVVTPLIILLFLYQSNTPGRTYKDVSEKYAPDLSGCIQIDHDIVQQIMNAEAAGLDSILINVPQYPFGENWPIMTPPNHSHYYSHALYKHNQIKRKITTILIPSFKIE